MSSLTISRCRVFGYRQAEVVGIAVIFLEARTALIFADLVQNIPTKLSPDGLGAVNIGHPKGVIAVISPWNLPLLLMTWVGPALACSNTVIVKPSANAVTTALLGNE